MKDSLTAPSHAPRPSIEQLYEISRALTGFEGLRESVPALLAIAEKCLALRGAVVIETKGGRPRLLAWHPPRRGAEAARAAKAHALREHAYLAGTFVPLVDPEVLDFPLELSGPPPAEEEERRFIVLPLVANNGRIFGALQMELAGPVDAQGLAFANAVANLLSLSLDRHYAHLAQAAAVSEGLQDEAVFMLASDGRIASWNPGAERLSGYGGAEVIGRHFSILYPQETRARASEELDEASAQGRCEREGWRVRKDGSRFWAGVVTTVLRDNDGKTVGFARANRDLTERRKIEEALRSSEQELSRHARELEQAVADLEAFSHTVSHNLRGPLRAVQSYAYYALKNAGPRLDAESRGMLDKLSRAALRMDRLIRDLLSYSAVRRAERVMAPLDLDPLVAHLVEDYPKRERAKLRVKTPLGRVMGDESLMTQALSNLIENAVKFVPAGRAPVAEVWSERKGDRLILNVRDNGIGIAEEHHARIFEPFARVAPAGEYEGTGIGLAIVKGAVERMGGRVGLESSLGKASRFWIELPAA